MDSKIQAILNDLYKLDASLKDYEEQIINIVDEYMKAKPDTKFDQEFATRLKSEILARAGELKKSQVSEKKVMSMPFMLFAGKFTYALVGAAVVLLVMAVPLASYFGKSGQLAVNNMSGKLALDFKAGVAKIGEQAFGQLSGANRQDAATMNSVPSQENAGSAKQNAGALRSDSAIGNKAISQTSPALGLGGGGGAAGSAPSQKIMPPYESASFNFVYKGEEIKQALSKLPVFKRVKASLAGSDIGQLLTNTKTGLVDLSKFSGANATNINLTEDKEYGYMISFDFTNASISIFPNWQKWPRPDRNCQTEACYNQYRVKYGSVPSDEKIISIADDFLSQYGVDKEDYGQPYITDYWRREYERAQDKTLVYIPEEMTAVYSLVINGETVYDESGNPTGLSVNVNIVQNKVSSVNVITPLDYESSDYAAVTDNAKIMEIAKRGGMYGYYQYGDSGKQVDVELGTPKLALMRYYLYNSETQNSDELYIPAYIFPVTSISDLSVYFDRKNIVVPLSEEIFKEIDLPIGPGEPMPLGKSADGTAPNNSVSPEVPVQSNVAEPGF